MPTDDDDDDDLIAPGSGAPVVIDDGEGWSARRAVLDCVQVYLQAQGYSLEGSEPEAGRDVVARNWTGPLWVMVLGFPVGNEEHSGAALAGRLFTAAVVRVLNWKAVAEENQARVAIALPDTPRYRKSGRDIRWLRPMIRFSLLWVKDDGKVEAQPALNKI